jgi:hypothetical protein
VEPDTVQKPKINKDTFKIGSGDLTKRVANNEKKITLLKNVFKAQKTEIGEKITPKVNTLEESLINTTQILGVISEKLQLDMDQRIKDQKAAFENQRKLNLINKRDNKEDEIESKKKVKRASTLGKAVAKPFVGMFDKLKQLAMILGGGILGTNLIRSLQDKDFVAKLEGIYKWTTKNWKALAIAGGVLLALDLGAKLFGAFKVLKFAFRILTTPILLKALAAVAFAWSAFKVFEAVDKNIDSINDNFRDKKEEMLGRKLDSVENKEFDNAKSFTKEAVRYNFATASITGGSGFFFPTNRKDGINNVDTYIAGGEVPTNLPEFEKTKLNLEKEYNKLVKEKKIPKVNVVDGGTIGLNENNQIREYKSNNLPATDINVIPSMNVINPYMEQVPIAFGFSDLVYS